MHMHKTRKKVNQIQMGR